MSSLETLVTELGTLDQKHDLDGLRRVRLLIVDSYTDTEEATEALYKIGLDSLFRARNLDEAIHYFEQASARKHAFWSAASRTSLALCYFHQNRSQKALFELRKVAYVDPPTAHSITALVFMENIYGELDNQDLIGRTRKDRVRQLEKMLDADPELPASEKGYYMYQLGLALLDSGDEDSARTVLEECKQLGPETLGTEIYRGVVEALR